MNTISIIKVSHNEDVYLYALDRKKAEQAFSEHWASDLVSEKQCHFEELQVEVQTVCGQIVYDNTADQSGHFIWKCPLCSQNHESGIGSSDKLPLLLMCENDLREIFFLGEAPAERVAERVGPVIK